MKKEKNYEDGYHDIQTFANNKFGYNISSITKNILDQKFFLTNCKNCIGFRTSSLAKNRCAQARPNFWIPPQNKRKMRGLALGKPTHPLLFPKKVPFWCVFTTPLEPILSKIRENIHKRSPRAEAPLCEAQSFCWSRSAGERSARHTIS